MNEYLRVFFVSSSILVIFIFLFIVNSTNPIIFHSYYLQYSFIAPFIISILNTFALWISKVLDFSTFYKYLFLSIFTPSCVLAVVFLEDNQTFSTGEWIQYIWGLYIIYFFVFNVFVHSLYKE
jgi:hypothetical protein